MMIERKRVSLLVVVDRQFSMKHSLLMLLFPVRMLVLNSIQSFRVHQPWYSAYKLPRRTNRKMIFCCSFERKEKVRITYDNDVSCLKQVNLLLD